MPIRVDQGPEMAPGEARLLRLGTDLSTDGLEISIVRLDAGSPRYLDPRYTDAQAWGAGERWFAPDTVEAASGAISMTLGPSATWNLKPHTPFVVKLRDAAGSVVEDRMTWKAIRLPSAAPPPGRSDRIETPKPEPIEEEDPLAHFAAIAEEENAAAPLTETPTVTTPVPPVQIDPPEPKEPETQKTHRSRVPMIAGILLLLAAIGGGAYAYFMHPDLLGLGASEQIVEADDGPELSLVGARSYLREKPAAADAAAQATRFAEAKQADAAFLLRSYAARNGDAASSAALGDLYAPETFTEGGVLKAADATRAAEYYIAASAELPDALLKAGALFKAGQISDPAVSDKVEAALKTAADAGNAQAKEFLE